MSIKFKKNLSQLDVWGLALGAIIGWGCFVLPGNAFLPKAGPLGTALGLGLGAVLVIIISLSYGYLIRKYPATGGEYIYSKSMFGKTHGFISGWALILAYWTLVPLNGTAVALIFRYLFPGIIQVGYLYDVAGWDVYLGEVLVASAFMVLTALVNIHGIKSAGWLQTAVALTLVGGILLLTAIVMFQGPDFSNLQPYFPEGKTKIGAIFAIMAMAPWAYLGFDCIPQAAEEYNFSHGKSLKLMVLSILFAAVLYICMNTVTSIVIPWQELLSQKPFWATGMAVEIMLGKAGLVLLGIAMFCAVISGMNAFYISTSRLMYAMAQEHALPQWLGHLHPKKQTPSRAIIIIMCFSLIAPWFGREVLGWIVDMSSVGGAVVFGYTSLSAAKFARKNGEKRQQYIGYLGFIIAMGFLSILVVPGMPGFLSIQALNCLAIWILMGVVAYFVVRKKYIKS